MSVRAFYRAATMETLQPPYNHVTLKITYPAMLPDNEHELNSGYLTADPKQAPFPIVIMMPGINVGPEAYSWLAQGLAARGIVTVTYSFVTEELPGLISLSPGIDLEYLKPEQYGKAPTATALAAIIKELTRVNDNSVLKGTLALDKIILGGHSAGGTVALLNGHPGWFPGLVGVFSYGAHTAAATTLGWPDNSYLPTPSLLPTLMIGGDCDGVIEGSQMRYSNNTDNTASSKLEQSFEQAITSTRGDCHLAILSGANHFAIAYPEDSTTGRGFLDKVATRPGQNIRQILEKIIGLFISDISEGSQRLDNHMTVQRKDFSVHRSK
jgi:dienelactone hydrolase